MRDRVTTGPVSERIEPPVAIMRSMVAAFSRGDIDAVLEHLAENCVVTVLADRCSPRYGRDSVRGCLETLYRELPGMTAQIGSVAASGNDIAVEVELVGLWAGELSAIAPAGAEDCLRACVWSVIDDGRIREQRIYCRPLHRLVTDNVPTRSETHR